MTSTSKPKILDGKVAIVTASSDGIGYAIAERLGMDGAKVMISSRKQQNVTAALEKLKAKNLDVDGMVCHVGKGDDRRKMIQKTVDRFGGIDILVSNAAVAYYGRPLQCTEEEWDETFDINVKATLLLCKEVVPHMEARGGGSIVIVSSVAGYNFLPSNSAYSVSKTTLLALTKGLVYDLQPRNIRVNCLAPGTIRTKMSESLWKDPKPPLYKKLMEKIPMQRIAEPHECAGPVSFLVSDDASYITGETIVVAGGLSARL